MKYKELKKDMEGYSPRLFWLPNRLLTMMNELIAEFKKEGIGTLSRVQIVCEGIEKICPMYQKKLEAARAGELNVKKRKRLYENTQTSASEVGNSTEKGTSAKQTAVKKTRNGRPKKLDGCRCRSAKSAN